jgi:hypothetical protein
MSQRRICDACGGAGHIDAGVGLIALEYRYPELPIREMARRGWLGNVGDGDDVLVCDAAFLRFWGVDTHAEVKDLLPPIPSSGGG